eukprot:7718756-Heterocapsa_arctica.AAC.1
MAGLSPSSGPANVHYGVSQSSNHSSKSFKSKRLTSTDVRSGWFIPYLVSQSSNHGEFIRTVKPLFPD